MKDQIHRLLGDLQDTLQGHHRRDWGDHSTANLVAFLGWFCEELALALIPS